MSLGVDSLADARGGGGGVTAGAAVAASAAVLAVAAGEVAAGSVVGVAADGAVPASAAGRGGCPAHSSVRQATAAIPPITAAREQSAVLLGPCLATTATAISAGAEWASSTGGTSASSTRAASVTSTATATSGPSFSTSSFHSDTAMPTISRSGTMGAVSYSGYDYPSDYGYPYGGSRLRRRSGRSLRSGSNFGGAQPQRRTPPAVPAKRKSTSPMLSRHSARAITRRRCEKPPMRRSTTRGTPRSTS